MTTGNFSTPVRIPVDHPSGSYGESFTTGQAAADEYLEAFLDWVLGKDWDDEPFTTEIWYWMAEEAGTGWALESDDDERGPHPIMLDQASFDKMYADCLRGGEED